MENGKKDEVSDEEFWKPVNATMDECIEIATKMLEKLINMRVEAQTVMIEFAAAHGMNSHRIQGYDDKKETYTEPKLIEEK